MNLSEYPAAIAEAAQTLNDLDLRIGNLRREMDKDEAAAELEIAFDATLKNDAQRKSQRFQLLATNASYQAADESLQKALYSKTLAVIALECLRNQFTIAKLEARLRIADLAAISGDPEV